MKVNLKHPVRFGKHVYKPGVHEFHDDMKKDWYMLALIGNGKASILEHGPKQPVAPIEPPEVVDPVVEPEAPEVVADEQSEEPKEKKSKKAKKKDE